MSTNSIHLNVHSYVYFKIPQNISCSTLYLVSFKVLVGEYTINLKRGQIKIYTNGRPSLCIYTLDCLGSQFQCCDCVHTLDGFLF